MSCESAGEVTWTQTGYDTGGAGGFRSTTDLFAAEPTDSAVSNVGTAGHCGRLPVWCSLYFSVVDYVCLLGT